MATKKDVIIAVLALTFCLTLMLFVTRPTISTTNASGPQYDQWADVSGTTPGVPDGKIDMKDIAYEVYLFNTHGTPINRSAVLSLEYDSGWINLTGQPSLNYTLTHNLNLTTADMIIDARQKTGLQKTYGGTGTDQAQSVVQTGDGGFALAGYTDSFGAGIWDCWLVKTDSNGNMEWNKTYGGANYDYANSVVQTSDEGYVLAGTTYSFGDGSGDFWLVKTDSAGEMLWNKNYGGTYNEYATSVVQTGDGGFALAGYTDSFGAGGWDCWLVKTDSNGNMEWNKTYGGAGTFDLVYSLVQTADGGFALAGSTNSFGSADNNLWLVKTDSDGNVQWNKTYGGTDGLYPASVVQTGDGGYGLASTTDAFSPGWHDFWLVKTDSNGNVQWNKNYGGAYEEWATSVVQTGDGGFALAGPTNSPHASSYDFWLVKADASGNMQWNKAYGGTGWSWAQSVVQTGDGGFALAGSTTAFGGGDYDFWLVKTDVEQGLAWISSSMNSITLVRDATIPWSLVRVQIWTPR